MNEARTLIVPCSGIGKVHGLIAREAAYGALEKLGPDLAGTICLSLLVPRDEKAVSAIRSHPCITVDGCPKLCSYKNLEMAGGRIQQSVRVVDALKEHKGAQPGTATSLTDDGWTIADSIARNLVEEVRRNHSASKEVQNG